ncbi:molybdenum cofactor sulfurase isoform X2 [Aristolochia californica]|uniref:molybdenum cofactor sulfurase isoform X2 n=1 Tax=Aristolochia californica TaxID=171875 RepID=UPI0035DBCEC9
MEQVKDEFVKEFAQDYGYPNAPKNIDEIRNSEFRRLDGLVYLDHAGASLYSESQLESIFRDFKGNVYGNPHSQSDTSSATSDIVRAARQQVLDYCNAPSDAYRCIFTSGATAALKIVGEAFPWSRESCYMYSMENHNSVLGIREYALNHGATALAVDIEEVEERSASNTHLNPTSVKIIQHPVQRRAFSREVQNSTIYNLFAFPSECNFSGTKFDLNLVNVIKKYPGRVLEGSPYCRGQWMVLLDAAKGCGTQPPDLTHFPADFVVISFYKIFGYPTGLGALVVRTEAAGLLKKIYFSGGTVAASVADIDFVKRREGIEEWFEDGTLSFLSIASLHHGFKIVNMLSISAISRHTKSLATYTRRILLALRHANGAPVCVIYERSFSKKKQGYYQSSATIQVSSWDKGPTIAFNLKRPDGSWFGHREVEKLASLSEIQLRTGCFCNPGACSKFLGLAHSDLLSNIEAGHVCWDDFDIIHGKPTGAVRISFGYMSTFEDAKMFINFIVSAFVSKQSQSREDYLLPTKMTPLQKEEGMKRSHSVAGTYLESIIIYPIKSCGGFTVDSWPLDSNGLRYDREWLLKSPSGEILTQKKVPEMSLINTSINLIERTLIVESKICEAKLQISIQQNSCSGMREEVDLYGHRYEVSGYNNEINIWFSKAVARPCTLLRCLGPASHQHVNKNYRIRDCRDVQSQLNFVNEAQLLLISKESVADLTHKVDSNIHGRNHEAKNLSHVYPMRFRPNFIISGSEPYAEDSWRSLYIGNVYFTSLGGCNRCQMVNLDVQAGQLERSKEPLATLASYRRFQGRILFGILLKYEESIKQGEEEVLETRVQVGQRIHPKTD